MTSRHWRLHLFDHELSCDYALVLTHSEFILTPFLIVSWTILNYLELAHSLVLLRWWPDQLRRVREDDDGQVSHERKLRAFQSLSSCAQQTQLWCTEPVACSLPVVPFNRLYHGSLLDVCNKGMQAKVQFDSSTFICRCYKPNHESSHNYVPVP